MNVYQRITFITLVDFLGLAFAATCGTLRFERETVTEGESARLIYAPINIYAESVWYKEIPGYSPLKLYDKKEQTSTTKYTEHDLGSQFALKINNVQQSDAGSYIVYCGASTFSERANLHVNVVSTTDNTTTPDTQGNCGLLTANKNRLSEGEIAYFIFKIRPGREIVWEKQTDNSVVQIYQSERFVITKNKERTVHDLSILNTIYTDSGTYRINCSHSVSNTVKLEIISNAPSNPQFLGVEDIDNCQKCIPAQIGVPVEIKCSVDGGSKPIELKLFKDGKIINGVHRSSGTTTSVEKVITPSTDDFDAVFTCNVKNPAMVVETATYANLYIKVNPKKVDVSVVKSVTENKTGEIKCISTQQRPPIKSLIYLGKRWHKDVQLTDVRKKGHTYNVTTSLVKVFTRIDNQKESFCCSDVITQKCSSTAKINVKFPPLSASIVEIKKENKENGDTELTLKCSVDESNPKSTIEWKGIKNVPRKMSEKEHRNHTQTHGWTFSTVWVFNLTREDNFRNIICQVTNPEFPDLTLMQSYRPNITYSPVITISESETKIAYIGDDVYLTCHVDSNPTSVITWFNETDQLEETGRAQNLDLHLANISLDHSQTYTCKARNGIGRTKTRNVTVIVKDASEKPYNQPNSVSDSPSVAGPVAGVAVVVVVVIVGVTVFLVLRKRRQNAAPSRQRSYQIKMEERKPSIHQAGNEPVYNNAPPSNGANGGEEQPEYACVIPKAERGEERQHLNPEGEPPKTENGDNLVYAELDLNNPPQTVTKRRSVAEPTEYVSIDFTKKGTVMIDNDEESGH